MKMSPVEAPQEIKNGPKPNMFSIINKPKELFGRVRSNPKIWVPLLIISLISAVGAMLTIDQDGILSMISEQGGMKLSAAEKSAIAGVTTVVGIIGGFLSPALGSLINSIVYMIVSKIIGASVTFKQLFSMCVHISLISALGALINGLILSVFHLSGTGWVTSISYYLGGNGDFLNSVELFSIWGLALTAIGLQVTAGFSKKVAWGVPVALFIIGLLFSYMSKGI
ncbi:YIP1 family protein [Bacillus sp. 1P06AnD]|uniref:YIP1 family protein n=1 Tax=Bacillus sp. 1P06AnD TaxID=3132208 RepID=UPI0039A27B45